jgi:DNA-binding CsgD family transcriptional regulator
MDIEAFAKMRVTLGAYDRSEVNELQNAPSPLDTLGRVSKGAGVKDPRTYPPFARFLKEIGVTDMAAFRTVEPGPRGIVVCAPQMKDRVFEPRAKRLWAKVSSHVAAAHRLRERLSEPVEAVLTTSGKLEHAEGESKHRTARDALQTAVLRQEKARGKIRREDPEGATTMWTALVAGRWSLVDHFERGGRRYIVARRNEHGGPDPRALGARERDVAQLAALGKSNKLIAYELGISERTVKFHRRNVLHKFGARSLADLAIAADRLGLLAEHPA